MPARSFSEESEIVAALQAGETPEHIAARTGRIVSIIQRISVHYNILAALRRGTEEPKDIAKRFGVTARSVREIAARYKVPLPSAIAAAAAAFTPEQDAAFVRAYLGGQPPAEIKRIVNALPGPRLVSRDQIYTIAKRLNVRRKLWNLGQRSRVPKYALRAEAAARAQAQAEAETAPMPLGPQRTKQALRLREVYAMEAAYDLPRNGDIEAVSRAARLEDPTHPGFKLFVPTAKGNGMGNVRELSGLSVRWIMP